ncbi:hypothetical protein TanjilG_07004 [Lupinus angustifolius]|uniref:ENTH domain-containing protein n=1 Tax=Lupinus angustifolius TaxID=3871 RepID=A0A1J7IL48_LUPAN|nr:PREDICTED: probable clathrin assembly protein At4g32285 [Lupinus angustifolius]OIW19549.1 hypothetical protein TanjilG_07004 [Lupinus angustifolius]
MASSTIRKAIGVVKDQTSISIAKVVGSSTPELDVLVVRATSHDEYPADDKYLREILSLTSNSRDYVIAFLITVSKRLGKTRDWIVALKALILFHRVLVYGHPMFEEEVVYSTRIGRRILNVSDFRDEAHSNSWDLACFVRLYALYLDEKIEFVVHQRKLRDHGVGDGGEFRYEFGGGFAMGRKNRSYDDVNGSSHGRENRKIEVVNVTPVREMEAGRILERLKHLLKILDRILWCTPNGAAKNNKLVLVALYQIVKDSFNIYAELCDVLGVVMDRFTEMEYAHCVKAFNAYVSAAKMFDELAGFYCWCKDIGITRSLEYPEVLKITDKLLGTLKGFLKDNRPKSPNKIIATKVIVIAKEPEPEVDMNEVKALPPLENHTTPPPPSVPQPKPVPPTQQVTNDLVNLRDGGVSADEQGNKLALELFSGPAAVRTEGSWGAFPSNGESEVTSVWQTPAAELGKVDWELALAESCSNLSKQEANLAGGFDQLLLNSLYDQGAVRQHVSTNQMSGGSASSVALPGADKSATAVLALPSPDGTVQVVGPQDPFAASLSLPPPSYVQIADMERKQHLFVPEQQLWQQYGRDGMQGQVALARAAGGPSYSALVPQPMMMPHGMPQFGGGMGQTGGYYHTPY